MHNERIEFANIKDMRQLTIRQANQMKWPAQMKKSTEHQDQNACMQWKMLAKAKKKMHRRIAIKIYCRDFAASRTIFYIESECTMKMGAEIVRDGINQQKIKTKNNDETINLPWSVQYLN